MFRYKTNEPLLNMMLLNKPKLGLLGIVDEESNFPKATDSTMIIKLHAMFTSNENECVYNIYMYICIFGYSIVCDCF